MTGKRAVCGRCGEPIPPGDLLTARDGGRSWRCLPCTIDDLMRQRGTGCAATEPPPLHRMGQTA